MKKTLCLITAPLLLAGGTNAATVSLDFENLDLNSGTVSSGSIARDTANVGSPQEKHTTVTVTGVDLNEDAINDTFSFILKVSGSGAVGTTGSGANQSYDIGSNNIESGETISFAVSTFVFTNGAGGTAPAPTISFDGFTNVNILFAHNGGETYSLDGGTSALNTGDTSPFDQVIAGSPSTFTVTAMDTTGATATSFRVRDLDLGFTIAAVPEPSSTALLGLGGLALILRRRK